MAAKSHEVFTHIDYYLSILQFISIPEAVSTLSHLSKWHYSLLNTPIGKKIIMGRLSDDLSCTIKEKPDNPYKNDDIYQLVYFSYTGGIESFPELLSNRRKFIVNLVPNKPDSPFDFIFKKKYPKFLEKAKNKSKNNCKVKSILSQIADEIDKTSGTHTMGKLYDFIESDTILNANKVFSQKAIENVLKFRQIEASGSVMTVPDYSGRTRGKQLEHGIK